MSCEYADLMDTWPSADSTSVKVLFVANKILNENQWRYSMQTWRNLKTLITPKGKFSCDQGKCIHVNIPSPNSEIHLSTFSIINPLPTETASSSTVNPSPAETTQREFSSTSGVEKMKLLPTSTIDNPLPTRKLVVLASSTSSNLAETIQNEHLTKEQLNTIIPLPAETEQKEDIDSITTLPTETEQKGQLTTINPLHAADARTSNVHTEHPRSTSIMKISPVLKAHSSSSKLKEKIYIGLLVAFGVVISILLTVLAKCYFLLRRANSGSPRAHAQSWETEEL